MLNKAFAVVLFFEPWGAYGEKYQLVLADVLYSLPNPWRDDDYIANRDYAGVRRSDLHESAALQDHIALGSLLEEMPLGLPSRCYPRSGN